MKQAEQKEISFVKKLIDKIEVKFWLIVGLIYFSARLVFGLSFTLDELGISLIAYIWGLINIAPILLKKNCYMPYSNTLLEPRIHSFSRLFLLLIYLPLVILGLFYFEFMEFIGE